MKDSRCFSPAVRYAIGALVILGSTTGTSVLAQDGAYDASFAAGGRRLVEVGDGDDAASAVRVLADGRVVVAGHCTEPSAGFGWPCVTRLTATGALDSTYGFLALGRVRFDALNPNASRSAESEMLIQPDGSVISVRVVSLGPAVEMDMIGADGRSTSRATPTRFPLDLNFAIELLADAVRQSDGKVLACLTTTLPPGGMGAPSDIVVSRADPATGQPDLAFGGGDGSVQIAFDLDAFNGNTDRCTAIGVQSDGRIVVAGNAAAPSGRVAVFARLMPNGDVDGTFGDGGKTILTHSTAFGEPRMRIDGSDRIVYAYSTTIGGSNYDQYVARLTRNGLPDPQFRPNGPASPPGPARIAIDLPPGGGVQYSGKLAIEPGGNIVVTGNASRVAAGTYFTIARLLGTGALDPAFGLGGSNYGTFSANPSVGYSDTGVAVAIGNGAVFVAGVGTPSQGAAPQFGVAKLTSATARGDVVFGSGFE